MASVQGFLDKNVYHVVEAPPFALGFSLCSASDFLPKFSEQPARTIRHWSFVSSSVSFRSGAHRLLQSSYVKVYRPSRRLSRGNLRLSSFFLLAER